MFTLKFAAEHFECVARDEFEFAGAFNFLSVA